MERIAVSFRTTNDHNHVEIWFSSQERVKGPGLRAQELADALRQADNVEDISID